MPYSRELGYEVRTIDQIMDELRVGFNTEFNTTYDETTFQGTGAYRYYYFTAQQIQKIETKASEVFNKASDYILMTNQRIASLGSSSNGFLARMEALGYIASIDLPTFVNKGILNIAVDVNGYDRARLAIQASIVYEAVLAGTGGNAIQIEYVGGGTAGSEVITVVGKKITVAIQNGVSTANQIKARIDLSGPARALISARILVGQGTNTQSTETLQNLSGGLGDETLYPAVKNAVNEAIKENTVAGMVFNGPELSQLALSNGQQFNFSYYLPNRIPVLLKIVLDRSPSVNEANPSDGDIRINLFQRISMMYRLGRDFEPQRYVNGAWYSWAKTITLFWSDDNGVTWYPSVYASAFNEVFSFNLNEIQVEVN